MFDSYSKHIKHFFLYLLTFLLGTQALFSKVEINQVREKPFFEIEAYVNTFQKPVQSNISFLKAFKNRQNHNQWIIKTSKEIKYLKTNKIEN